MFYHCAKKLNQWRELSDLQTETEIDSLELLADRLLLLLLLLFFNCS